MTRFTITATCIFLLMASAYSETVQITTGGYHPRFSPDGTRIVYTDQIGGEPTVFMVDVNGDNNWHLNTGITGDHHLSWHPDGTRIFFDARTPGGSSDIYSIPATGGTRTRIPIIPDSHEFVPVCSPDGNYVAYSHNYNGRNRYAYTALTGGVETTILSTTWSLSWLCWSPDGTKIAFGAALGDWTDQNFDIYTMPVAGGTPTKLTTATSKDVYPVWSPDGTTIVFASNRTGNYDLWAIPAEGGTPVQLTDTPGREHFPDWSPDGSKIAFAGENGICVMDYPFFESCCGEYNEGATGNANCSADGKLTLTDITALIDHVYISKAPLCCPANGNTNGDPECQITLSDITRLIDHVYISKGPTATCVLGCG